MRKENGSKIIAIIALVVGVVGLAIGFAAFSSTLTISSSASVKPDSSTFKIELSTKSDSTSTELTTSNYNGLVDTSNISIEGTKISGLKANFTEPGSTANYYFYVRNVGEYVAYLKSITGGAATCTPGSGTTKSLVDVACENISITVTIYNVELTNGVTYNGKSGTISGSHSIAIDGYSTIWVNIMYAGTARADGPFTVNFDDITLLFESTN